MKVISKEHFGRMEMMCRAFGNKSKSNSLFLTEYKASEEINEMISSINKPTQSDFEKIVGVIKNTDSTKHYNGSQWYDYKIHLNALLRENGFESNII
ncbi:hypothetical protein [Winogradskyella undariae]|uniref:hypothetical protein n=1 Tax=Winogradskyella undariae TaxID=1285465 RepID=UPI0015CE540C|nr:hypothetical protein [Winogradskyella undariae]